MSRIENSDDPRPAKGRARQLELSREHVAAIKINSASMIAGLFRPAAVDEIALAESICSLLYKASKLRECGRSDLDHLREAGILLKDWRALARGPAPTAPSE